jgi:hypothetical protein
LQLVDLLLTLVEIVLRAVEIRLLVQAPEEQADDGDRQCGTQPDPDVSAVGRCRRRRRRVLVRSIRRAAVTLMRVRARITAPAEGSTIDRGTHTVRGKAWSGTGPVTEVDVSLTGEGDWHAARVEPPSGPYHWQDWSFDWAAEDVGRHTLRARATDAAGHTQPELPPWNRLGYGNNAVEVIYIDVR